MSRRLLATLVFAFVCLLGSAPRASGGAPQKTIVLYVEAQGVDPGSIRVMVRNAIPNDLLVVDASDFRVALAAKGERGLLSKRLKNPKTLDRVRRAAAEVHADGVVLAIAKATFRERQVRIVFIDARSSPAGEDSTAFDSVVVLGTKKAESDQGKIKESIGPVLERFASVERQAPEAPHSAPAPPPVAPPIKEAPPPRALPPPVTPAAPPYPPNNASLAVQVFPVAGLYSTAFAQLSFPLSRHVLFQPAGGAAYRAPAKNGETDIGWAAALGFTYLLGPGWSLSPSLFYVHEVFVSYALSFSGTLAPAVKFNLALTGDRYTLSAFPSPLFEAHAWLDFPMKPFKWLQLLPHGAYFLYDRDLRDAKDALTPLGIGLAPYPILGMVGLRLGIDTGRWIPYASSRHFFYAADIGYSNAIAIGVRLQLGEDFIDARVGAIFSVATGPFADEQLAKVPVANLEAGWAF